MIKTAMLIIMLGGNADSELLVEKTLFEDSRSCESKKMELLSGNRDNQIDIICLPHIEPQMAVKKIKVIVDGKTKVKLVKNQEGLDAIKHLNQIHEAYDKIPYDGNGDITRDQIIDWFVDELRPIMQIQRGGK